MPSTAEVNQAAANFIADTNTADEKINSPSALVTDRHGRVTKNLERIFSEIGYLAPVSFTSGLTPDSGAFTVLHEGRMYGADPSQIPFTTSATFDANQWVLLQSPNLPFFGSRNQADATQLRAKPEGTVGALDGLFYRVNSNATVSATSDLNVFGLEAVSPIYLEHFGAVGDGTTDDAAAIQRAADYGPGIRNAMAKTYRMLSTPVFPPNVSLHGAGSGATIFDGRDAAGANLTDVCSMKFTGGDLVALPDLSVDASKNHTQLTFASAPNVSVGDVIIIYNPTDYSWSGARSYYHAGEKVKVVSVAGNVVQIEGSLCDSYPAASVDLYHMNNPTTCDLRGFTVKGCNAAATATRSLGIERGVGCSLSDVKSDEGTYIGIGLSQCFGVSLLNCEAADNLTSEFGGDYGLSIGNSCYVTVLGGRYVGARHGLAIGGGADVGDVPNRFLHMMGVHITTAQDLAQAGDIHGNAEFVTYESCTFDGGSTFAGDHSKFINNVFRGNMNNGPVCLYAGEMKGGNHLIQGNTFETSEVASGRACWIDVGGNSTAIDNSKTTRGGTIRVIGNHFRRTGDPGNQSAGCIFYQRGYLGAEPINIAFENNFSEIEGVSDPLRRVDLLCQVRSQSGKWGMVSFCNNTGNGGFDSGTNSGAFIADRIYCEGNRLKEGSVCTPQDASELITFKNNVLDDFRYYAGAFGLSDASRCALVEVSGNTARNMSWQRTSSSSTNTGLLAWYAKRAICKDNFMVNTFRDLRVIGADDANGFSNGETVTGATSGATATVYSTRDPWVNVRDSIVGAFQAGETITGSVSGHTATLETTPENDTRTYWGTFYNIDDFYGSGNIDAEGKGIAKGSITSDNFSV